jgi:predicted nuclease of predicted toxin-antitoxin system
MNSKEHILADENVPGIIIKQLRLYGFDIKSITEFNPSISDHEVAELACLENRIILTADKDFGEMAFRDAHRVPGIILLRLGGLTPTEMASITCTALDSKSTTTHLGTITVITPDSLKVRPLPRTAR